jgi:hypothetical protein
MKRRILLQAISVAPLLPVAKVLAGRAGLFGSAEEAKVVYELRIYHCYPGKLPELLARFRDHTTKLFERHGMKNVVYWTALDEPMKSSTLCYVLAHPSREAATANWKAFQDDPEWQSVKAASEANGKIVEKVDSTFLEMTDFSPLLR